MYSMTRTMILLIVAISGVAHAQSYPIGRTGPYYPPYQVEQSEPAAILKAGLRKLLAFARQNDNPAREEVRLFLDREIAPYFDFSYMARWAGGRSWRYLGEARRLELEQQIKVDFLTTLAMRLSGYEGQQVRILRTRRDDVNQATVMVGVLNPGRYPAQLEFRFYRSPEGWRVFDVSANGSSAIMHYRTKFNRAMRLRGGQGGYRPIR